MHKHRVHLVGAFAGFHDGPIEVYAATAWDAVEAVVNQLKGFLPDASTGRKVVQLLGFDTLEALKSTTSEEDLYLAPSLVFGKNGGMVQTLIGIALIAVAFIPGLNVAVWGVTYAFLVGSVGVGLVVGGLMQMLTPQPQLGGRGEEEARSKYLGGIQNTVAIGTTIPLLYGRRRIGGHILSMNIDAKATST